MQILGILVDFLAIKTYRLVYYSKDLIEKLGSYVIFNFEGLLGGHLEFFKMLNDTSPASRRSLFFMTPSAQISKNLLWGYFCKVTQICGLWQPDYYGLCHEKSDPIIDLSCIDIPAAHDLPHLTILLLIAYFSPPHPHLHWPLPSRDLGPPHCCCLHRLTWLASTLWNNHGWPGPWWRGINTFSLAEHPKRKRTHGENYDTIFAKIMHWR